MESAWHFMDILYRFTRRRYVCKSAPCSGVNCFTTKTWTDNGLIDNGCIDRVNHRNAYRPGSRRYFLDSNRKGFYIRRIAISSCNRSVQLWYYIEDIRQGPVREITRHEAAKLILANRSLGQITGLSEFVLLVGDM